MYLAHCVETQKKATTFDRNRLIILAVWTGQIGVRQVPYIQTITKPQKSSPPCTPPFKKMLIIKCLVITSKCD